MPSQNDQRRPKLKRFEFDAEKFKELIVYIAAASRDDPTFGAVKLNKILYYTDFAAYRRFGQPITGATYFKLREGPAPRELLVTRDELIEQGRLRIEEQPYFGYMQKRLVPSEDSEPAPEFLSPEEQKLVEEIIAFFRGKTAREVSDYSHREPGWIIAEDRADIPYESAWLSAEPVDQETEEEALRIGLEILQSRQ